MPEFSATRLIGAAQRLRVKPVDRELRSVEVPLQPEGRRAEISDNLDNWGSEHVVKGQVLLRGSGEATVEIPFHRFYTAIPTFSFGSALLEEAVVTPGNFPELNACVGSWEYHRPDLELTGINMREYYTGATVLVVATGPIDMDRYFHYHFSGPSLTNPIPNTLSVTGGGSLTQVIT